MPPRTLTSISKQLKVLCFANRATFYLAGW